MDLKLYLHQVRGTLTSVLYLAFSLYFILLLRAGSKLAAPFCPRAEQNTIPYEFAFNMSLNIATLACFENI